MAACCFAPVGAARAKIEGKSEGACEREGHRHRERQRGMTEGGVPDRRYSLVQSRGRSVGKRPLSNSFGGLFTTQFL